MPKAPKEVDIFKKYTKNNKLLTFTIALGIAVVVFFVMFFLIKIVVPHTIKFETFGGTVIEDVSYRFLQKTKEPHVKKEGFYIEKWSKDEDLSSTYHFGTRIWSSMTLYVDWQPGFALVLNFAEGEENEDLSLENLKLIYEQYVKPGSSWTLPTVYNQNKDSYHYGERLVWFADEKCEGEPLLDKTYNNITENINFYGKWFDISEDKFDVSETGELQRYKGYCANIILPSNVKSIKNIEPEKFIIGTDQLNEQKSPNASVFSNVIKSLEMVFINKELTSVGDCAFKSCENLYRLEFMGNNVNYIGVRAFTDTAIKEINIPGSVKTIKEYCFYNAKQLKNVFMNVGVKEIENNAFENCSSLISISMPTSLEIIEAKAFASCHYLKSFYLTSINLVNINLGIDEEQLRQEGKTDNQIRNMIIQNNVFFDTAGAVELVNRLTIYVSEDLLDDYKSAYGWNIYANYIKVN